MKAAFSAETVEGITSADISNERSGSEGEEDNQRKALCAFVCWAPPLSALYHPQANEMEKTFPDSKIILLASGKRLFIDTTPLPSPTSPSLIFLHGLGSSTTFYEAALSLSGLSSSHQTIRYDFDGHGLSPVSGEPVSIDSLVEDLREVLDVMGVKRAGIVAHSMSGLVASTFASRYPNRVTKVCASPHSLRVLPALIPSQSSSDPSKRWLPQE